MAIAAVVVNFLAVYAICIRLHVNASPAVLSAALTTGLMQRPERLSARRLLVRCVSLPLVALAAGALGLAFLSEPVAGAVLFCAGIALSIWLRRFGERGKTIGRTIALPLMAILVVPMHVEGGKLVAAFTALAAGLIAFAGSAAAIGAAGAAGLLALPKPEYKPSARAPRQGAMPVENRMALQMLTALACAFVVGFSVFSAHWPWVVLTAFIVTSGAAGRGDAIYKGLLRLGGAIGGTLAASAIALIAFPNPPAYAATVFLVLFLGIWLRQLNYAYWAACATLIFALLQGANGQHVLPLAAMRILGIVLGTICAIAATWFVFPIRTEQIVRRRVADALAAVRVAMAAETPQARDGQYDALAHHAAELHRIAPPLRLHRSVFGAKGRDEHPATWIDRMHALLAHVRSEDFDRTHATAEMRRVRDWLRGGDANRSE